MCGISLAVVFGTFVDTIIRQKTSIHLDKRIAKAVTTSREGLMARTLGSFPFIPEYYIFHHKHRGEGLCCSMAPIHQNGRLARAGKVGQLAIASHCRSASFDLKMPSHANCVVPGCPNRKDQCNWGLFPGEEDVQGRKVYVKRRLCGYTLDRVGCGNAFHLFASPYPFIAYRRTWDPALC